MSLICQQDPNHYVYLIITQLSPGNVPDITQHAVILFSYHSHPHDNTKLALVNKCTITCGPRDWCGWMAPMVYHEEVNSSHVREMRGDWRTMVEAARESKGGQKANERRRARTAPPLWDPMYLLTHFKCSQPSIKEF